MSHLFSKKHVALGFLLFFGVTLFAPFAVSAQTSAPDLSCQNVDTRVNLWRSFRNQIPNEQTTAITAEEAIEGVLCRPNTQINILNFAFSDPQENPERFLTTLSDDGSVYLQVPFLGEYIAAIYQYAIIAISILAVIRIIVAGIQWMLPGENNIASAKKGIINALIGLTIAVGSYTLLFNINPTFTELGSALIRYEPPEYIPTRIRSHPVYNIQGIDDLPGAIEAAAERYGIEPELIAAIMRAESSLRPEAISSTGCSGLMQICGSSSPMDVIRVQCNQRGASTPQQCDVPSCHEASEGGFYWCDRCSPDSTHCELDQRFDIELNVIAAASIILSKTEDLQRAPYHCDPQERNGIMAISAAYNIGQGHIKDAIERLPSTRCTDYQAIWRDMRTRLRPPPISCRSSSDCGGNSCTSGVCTDDGDQLGELNGSWRDYLTNRKIDNLSGEGRTYVTQIYNDYVRFKQNGIDL